jgi:hypothetical protein
LKSSGKHCGVGTLEAEKLIIRYGKEAITLHAEKNYAEAMFVGPNRSNMHVGIVAGFGTNIELTSRSGALALNIQTREQIPGREARQLKHSATKTV